MTAAEFRAIREKLGLTQAQLAAVLGVRQEHISRCQTGKEPISPLIALAMRAIDKLGHPESWG